MNIQIVCAGKLKERYFIDAAAEYEKRLSRYCALTVSEVRDESILETASAATQRAAVAREGERILSRIRSDEHVIALCVGGKRYSSEAFAERLSALAGGGRANIAFIIGGSCGLSDAVLARADETLSVSDMTLPHRLCRIFLLEQIYRAFKINAHEAYHK